MSTSPVKKDNPVLVMPEYARIDRFCRFCGNWKHKLELRAPVEEETKLAVEEEELKRLEQILQLCAFSTERLHTRKVNKV